MAFETFKGTFVAPTSTGNQTITGIPFQPKAVEFWSVSLVSGAGNTTTYLISYGAATGLTTQQFAIGAAQNGTTASNSGRRAQTGACILLPLNGNFAVDAVAAWTAWTSDGFTINWSDASATANLIVHYFAYGGTDLTNAKAGAHTIVRTTAGTEATSGLGFAPDYVSFASPEVPHATSIIDTHMAQGAATATQQWALCFFDNDAANNMDTFQRRSTSKCIVLADATSVLQAEASLSSLDADGFTLNWTDPVTVASSRVFYYLALKGGQYDLGADSTPTSTGAQAVTTGFEPKGVFLSWINRTLAVDTTTTAAGDSGFGVGAVDSSLNQGYVVINQTDADGNSQAWRSHSAAAAVRVVKGTTAAMAARAQAQADSGALTATGFQLNWTVVDAAAYQYHYVAFGDTPVAAAVPPPRTQARYGW
jgi:hypothetical protein